MLCKRAIGYFRRMVSPWHWELKQEQRAYRSYKIWQTCVKHGYLFLFLKPVWIPPTPTQDWWTKKRLIHRKHAPAKTELKLHPFSTKCCVYSETHVYLRSKYSNFAIFRFVYCQRLRTMAPCTITWTCVEFRASSYGVYALHNSCRFLMLSST